MQIRKRVAGVAITASLLGSILGAPSAMAGSPAPYGSYCSEAGSSGFTNTTSRTRLFGYVWRVGTTVLGGGSVRLAAGASMGPLDTPDGATKFGVVTSSTTYAYIGC